MVMRRLACAACTLPSALTAEVLLLSLLLCSYLGAGDDKQMSLLTMTAAAHETLEA